FAPFAVTAVAELGKRAAAAFQVARRYVVEHQRTAGEMAFGEGCLDCWLAYRQTVECAIELVLVDHPESELLGEAGGRGVRRTRARGGKLGRGLDAAGEQRG